MPGRGPSSSQPPIHPRHRSAVSDTPYFLELLVWRYDCAVRNRYIRNKLRSITRYRVSGPIGCWLALGRSVLGYQRVVETPCLAVTVELIVVEPDDRRARAIAPFLNVVQMLGTDPDAACRFRLAHAIRLAQIAQLLRHGEKSGVVSHGQTIVWSSPNRNSGS